MVKSRVELERKVGPFSGTKRMLSAPGHSRLAWLATVYGSDKGPTAHRYVDLYDTHLAPLRRRARRVLEIGVYRGASLQMWRDYFPNAEIFGLDIEEVHVPGPRIHTIRGDQADVELLAEVGRHGPFDLIVDDGSHRASDVVTTFTALFPTLREHGLYVIEDMQTAYDEIEYGGGPPGAPGTSASLVAGLVDAVNRHHVAEFYPDAAGTLPPVGALHVYPRIAFIERGKS